jgi:dihydrofolate synthase/folylpolyglutamate synthase
VFDYYLRFVNFEESARRTIREYRLDRMNRLLSFFGNPHRSLRTIHIAGSKGKGSTALFIARALQQLGHTTGLYASPHVSSYKERISLAGDFFPDDAYLRSGNTVAEAIPEFALREREGSALPTTFELLTLTAFLLFRDEGCDWAVIETGIGGRLDATNVITPEASVITPVELEHTDLLGDTIEEIAGEKAGIIKEGVPVFVGYQRENAAERFRQSARDRSSPLYELAAECRRMDVTLFRDRTSVELEWRSGGQEHFHTRMLGNVQAENAALALLVLRTLLKPDAEQLEAVRSAFAETRMPGRMELIADEPPLICDGAHTVASVGRLLDSIETMYPETAPVVIFGAVLGKNWEGMAALLAERCRAVVVSKPGTFKQSDPEALWRICRDTGVRTVLEEEPEAALRTARSLAPHGEPILVTGSFYMAAEIRNAVERHET